MKRFYLAGQNNFGNRGCEALVRSTLELLKEQFGDVQILVPSFRPELDSKQWPTAEEEGCVFVRAIQYPTNFKFWTKARNILPLVKHNFFPNYKLPKQIASDLASCDALLMIGGDNITLDYGIESLLWHIRLAQHAQRLGKKIMIWGASIGPFTEEPEVEVFVAKFLRSVAHITVRETISFRYLKEIGVVENVSLVADGAFIMTPQPLDISTFWPNQNENNVLGFNISPLIQKFRPVDEPPHVLQEEVANFLRYVLDNTSLSIALIPHVDPLDGAMENSDSIYMSQLLAMTGNYAERITLVPSTLNAAQIKYVLSKCKYFIGARTHATIGAISCFVPTVSIAYSVKAKGLNRDLFGNEDLVLDTPMVSMESLTKKFNNLVKNHDDISAFLRKKIPEWRITARLSSRALFQVLG